MDKCETLWTAFGNYTTRCMSLGDSYASGQITDYFLTARTYLLLVLSKYASTNISNTVLLP